MKHLTNILEGILDQNLDVTIPECFNWDYWKKLGDFKPCEKKTQKDFGGVVEQVNYYENREPIDMFLSSMSNIDRKQVRNISQARKLRDKGENTCVLHVSIGKRRNREWVFNIELLNCATGHLIAASTHQRQLDNGTGQWRQECSFRYKDKAGWIFIDSQQDGAARCVFRYYELPVVFFDMIKDVLGFK